MELDEEEDDFNFSEVNLADVQVAELQDGPPYVCDSLKLVKGKRKEKANSSNNSYSFDITKANLNFDVFLIYKQIILLERKKMPSTEEIKN